MWGSKSITAINALANNAFNQQITLSNKTVSPITHTFYVFNSSTDLQYNNTKFKRLFINLDSSTQLSSSINQLKVLQQFNTSVQLDKNKAGLANFIFGSESTTSIRLVILDILIKLIIFHIVPVSTLFLLCPADINKLGAFFNKIMNQVIQSQTQSLWSHLVIRKYGHAFLLWDTSVYTLATKSFALNSCYLTDIELRYLHRRFEQQLMHCLYQFFE